MVGDDSFKLKTKMKEFSKNQIRQYSSKVIDPSTYDLDLFCDKTILCFNDMNIPKTPFAVSLFVSICCIDQDFEPTNKSKIIERLVEILLEKLSVDEIYSKTYDFNSKCSFLSDMSYFMYRKNQYFFTINEFNSFVDEYHKRKKFSKIDTKFDTLFFDKKILINRNGKIQFRFKCFIYYFLARYCLDNDEVLIEIAESDKYYNFLNLFDYYTGMKRSSKILLNIISQKFDLIIEETTNINDLLNLTTIQTEFFNNDNFREKTKNIKPLNDEEKDLLTDVDIAEDYDTSEINSDEEIGKSEILLYTITILGNIVKNSEDLDGEIKKLYLRKFNEGTICLMAKIFTTFQNILFEFKERCLTSKGELDSDLSIKLDLAFSRFRDLVKIMVPLEMQSFICKTIGTAKLKEILIEEIYNSELNPYERFNYVALYCDLKITNWYDIIYEYLENCKSLDIRIVLFFKCWNYVRFNYFGDNTEKVKKSLVKLYELNGNKKATANNLVTSKMREIKLLKGIVYE